MKQARILLASLLLMAILAGITPTTQAQTASDWTNEVVPTGGVSATYTFSSISATNQLGVAFGTATDIGFSIRSATGVWTNKQTDLTGANNRALSDLVNFGAGKWAVVATVTNSQHDIYTTTDDGTNWALASTITVGSASRIDVAYGLATDTLVAVYLTGPSPSVNFVRSTDAGATWSTALILNDNCGAPSGCTPTANIVGSDNIGASIHATSSTNYQVLFGSGTSPNQGRHFLVATEDGGFFWTVPYTTNLGSTSNPIASTTQCPTTTSSTGAVRISTAGQMAWGATAATPTTNRYVCVTGTSYYPVPQAGPATAVVTQDSKGVAFDSNSAGSILAFDYGSDLQIWYAAGTGSPALVRTVANANPSFAHAVSMNATRAFVLYQDNSEGGRLELDTATVFTVPATTTAYRWNDESWFCSERGAPNFGYNYKEGVTFDDSQNPIRDLDSAYRFSGDADDFAYLGKIIPTPGVYGARLFFTLEADSEGTDSVFRAAFSMVDHSSYDLDYAADSNYDDASLAHYLNGPDDTGANAKGNGKDTEVFEEHIEARFLESGDDWNIKWFYVSTINGINERTPIGFSKLADAPNTPTSYVMEVDTRADAAYASIRHADGTQIGGGSVDALNVTLPDALVGQPIYGQWFIGYATDTAFNNNARTWVNNNDGAAGSTCLYLLEEVDTETGDPVTPVPCAGQCGTSGPTLVNTGNGTVPEGLATCAQTNTCTNGGAGTDTTGGGAADGDFFGDLDLTLFMGVLLVFGVIWMGIRQGAPGAAIGGLGFVGVFLGYAMGWIPIWVILVTFTIALAAAWFLPKPSKDGM